jgi:hypothetical protein
MPGGKIEYEGPFDRTLRLYESVRRAGLAVEGVSGSAEL